MNRNLTRGGTFSSSLENHLERGKTIPFTPVQYCNYCGHTMTDPRSFILEYWRSVQTVYFCWCHCCGNRWELTEVTTFATTEFGEGEDDF